MASPRVSAPLWDTDGVLVGGTRWKPVSSVRLQRYGFEFDALVRGEAHERAEKRVSGGDAAPLLASLGASREALRHIWNLADTERGGSLRFDEFVIACYLAERQAQGQQPPESLEAFPLGTFPPRAEGAPAPLVELPDPPRKARVTEVVPFDLTEPGSFNERASRRREEEAFEAAATAREKKFADPKRIEDLHAAAERKAAALEAERARVERERLAREAAECTFAPEKVSKDVDGDETRAPLRDRASGIVVARDQKRWLAGELLKREETAALKAEAAANGVGGVDLEVDPKDFAETTVSRWEEHRRRREDALDAERAARALEEAAPSVPRCVAPPVTGLEDEAWNDERWHERRRREGPWHERLSRTEKGEARRSGDDGDEAAVRSPARNGSGPSPSPTARSVDALHAARALHVEAQLRERRREAEAAAATKKTAETASASKMSSRSFEAHAARARKRLVAVMRLARALLAGDADAEDKAGGSSRRDFAASQTSSSDWTLPREAVARVLRATKMLPSTVPESREAQRDEARKVYRLCAALREDVDASPSDGDDRREGVSAVLVARFVGAGVQAGLERAGAVFDERAARRRLDRNKKKDDDSDADDSDAGVFGAAFDAGRVARAASRPWWPASFDDARADAARDAFESIAGARAACEALSRTPLGKKAKSPRSPGDAAARKSDGASRNGLTPASRTREAQSRSDIAERLAAKRAAADAAVEAARAARDALEAAECTFRPKLTPRLSSARAKQKNPSTPSLGGGSGAANVSSERVFSPSRAARALRRGREAAPPSSAFSAVTGERVEKPPRRTSREEAEARELAECTFAPRINRDSEYFANRRSDATKRNGVRASSVALARKPWEPRGARRSSPAPPRRPGGAPPGFENTVRRMREANARAAARKNLARGVVERRASWVDPREIRARLAEETKARKKANPLFRERERERRAAALVELKESRRRRIESAGSARFARAASARSSARVSVPAMASLTPAKTVPSPATRASPKRAPAGTLDANGVETQHAHGTPSTPFAFRVEEGLPPAPPRVSPEGPGSAASPDPAAASGGSPRAPRLPATPSTFGSQNSSTRTGGGVAKTERRPPRLELPRDPTPSARSPPRSSSKSPWSPSFASTPGSARSRSARSTGSSAGSPPATSARATLRMNKNAPSLLSSRSEGSRLSFGSPDGPSSVSDGYPYTKFVLGPPLARIELTIGEARGKTSFLTFHENETADGAARRFCDANRLPNSTVPDVRAVLREALRRNEIEPEPDDAFGEELSPRLRERRAPTLADLAA